MKINKLSSTEWNAILRSKSPQWRSVTAKYTAEQIDNLGVTAMKDIKARDQHDILGVMTSMALLSVKGSEINKELTESFPCMIYENIEFADQFRKLRIMPSLGVTPGWVDHGHGKSVDPYKQYLVPINEALWRRNHDGQYPITIYDKELTSTIFTGPDGLNAMNEAILMQPMNAFMTETYQLKREALYKGITSTDYPLRDTQKKSTSIDWTIDNPSDVLRKEFRNLLDTIDQITSLQVSSKAFNQAGVPLAIKKEDLVLMMRPGIYNQFKTFLKADSYNREIFDFPITVITVPDFAGLTPFKDAAFSTPLYPVYGPWGELIGFNSKKDQTVVEVTEDNVFWKDDLANLQYCLLTRQAIFMLGLENISNTVAYNERGLYATHYLNAPNLLIGYDHQETFVGFFNGDVSPNA